ncbi:E3 ubiquitin- ligase RBBP6-like isoform X2 [Labeo rohita]|uniref:E3 ubiquitin-protein ligase RBBP6 n=2 Tax=Labeo rohita TaxID=84645 RepID=A0ABQ8MLU8_LABRO|nr:E3 ubiquitin-protein ligase RBBP6 [Labeo rohita]RXN34818.1 E3 ubiquitin- ligase RBBP6-like isoform X2 [Labeo rohita]
MPCVHYKFRSKLSHDTIAFEGLHITLRELKRQIMRRERLKLCDLQVNSAQTNEEYTDDEALIPNNTSVIVRRIPAFGMKSTNKRFVNYRPEPSCGSSQTQEVGDSSPVSLVQLLKTENLAEANASEENKLKAVMFQSSLCYYSSSDAMKLVGLLPPNYICFRCGIPGHHIKNCPTNGDRRFASCKRIRKCAGIPRSFLVEVDDPDRKGVMMDRSGKYVIPIIDAEAYVTRKKEKLSFSPQDEHSSSFSTSSDPVPAVLLCLICKDLLTDAVMIPCCRSSYCDKCIRTCLLESDRHVCPTCSQSDVSLDALTANTVLHQEVNHFRNEPRSLHPNHSRQSRSPIPESSTKRRRDVGDNRSRSRSPLNRYTDQKRPRY